MEQSNPADSQVSQKKLAVIHWQVGMTDGLAPFKIATIGFKLAG
jgi:hypothetical protein